MGFFDVILGGGNIHKAIEREDVNKVRQLLEKHPELMKSADRQGMLPLTLAIHVGNAEIIDIILSGGTDINYLDESGLSPLYNAVISDRIDIVRMLLYSGAEVDFRSRGGSTVLFEASSLGDAEIVSMLISKGADGEEKAEKPFETVKKSSILDIVFPPD